MPSVSYNGQSFAIDGKRIWVLGASIQYARVPESLWKARIGAARQAGFNTIDTSCPWMIHEPRDSRFVFQGEANLRGFVESCAEQGMRVILRVGPFINNLFDGGGLPGWLIDTPGIRLREGDGVFLEHLSRYFRKLLAEVVDLQVTNGGPILLVQSEHAWTCSNDEQATRYLHEITRIIRESGINVPIVNANDLWQESPGTIDTWRGYDDLLVHLRQLRTVQPNAPRLMSTFDPAGYAVWGGGTQRGQSGESVGDGALSPPPGEVKSAGEVLRHLAEVLASGAQPIVSPFHAGTNFGFLAGRMAGAADRFVTTSAAIDAPLGEAGTRGEKYNAIRKLITFANHFGQVFAEVGPDYHPIVLDPERVAINQRSGTGRPRKTSDRKTPDAGRSASVVPLRGPQGHIVFVFGASGTTETTLVLEDGVRLPVTLGEQGVGWYALNVDLHGFGRLDYANICPWAIVDRNIVVFHGPARAPVLMSIDGTPLDTAVPADGAKPTVVSHKGLTIVICNQQQIDCTYHDESAVYVGISGFDAQGKPIRDDDFARPCVIRRDAKVENLNFAPEKNQKTNSPGPRTKSLRNGQSINLQSWSVVRCADHIAGQSPRYASLEGPATLSECGAPAGYGWYRMTVDASGTRQCHVPQSADRLHLFVDGKLHRLIGVGPGAKHGPFHLKLIRGEHTMVVLADNFGRFAEGNELGQHKGLWGHMYEVRAIRSAKPRTQEAKPVDPFSLRGFIAGRAAEQMSDSQQVVWRFAHPRKTPVLVDVIGARASGTFVLNDEPVEYYAGATGACMAHLMLDPTRIKAMKRGKNVLRFAPDQRQENACAEIAKCTTLYDCREAVTESAAWAFAKWEPPATGAFSPIERRDMKSVKGAPCWWRSTFQLSHPSQNSGEWPVWLEVAGLSKGQAFVNGRNLGRYFTATGDGRAVGPQVRLFVPSPWIRFNQPNEIMLFDEHGFDPARTRLTLGADSA